MRTAVVVLVLVLAVAETHAWVVVPKNALQKAAAAATISAALWTAPLVSNAANESQFAGSYSGESLLVVFTGLHVSSLVTICPVE